MSGELGIILPVVGHFQTYALSNVLVTLCSGNEEPRTSVLLEYELRYVLQLWN